MRSAPRGSRGRGGKVGYTWKDRALAAEGETARLRQGLLRLAHQDYDAGYTAEQYAEAILSGDEPSQWPGGDDSPAERTE